MLIFLGKIHTSGGANRGLGGAKGASKKEVQKSDICIGEGYDGMVECLNLQYEIKKMQQMTIFFDSGVEKSCKKLKKCPASEKSFLRFDHFFKGSF